MRERISVRGYTTVILVLNMKRFIRRESQKRFESIRGSSKLLRALRDAWPAECPNQDLFVCDRGRPIGPGRDEYLPAEHVGFATGVFRSIMLDEYATPTYTLRKENVEFPDDLETNFQFKNLFLRAWKHWHIDIRPTFTGFFVIRLTQHYDQRARNIVALAQDVMRLQESLDVRSALRWREGLRERFEDDPARLLAKERSVNALLRWLCGDETPAADQLYYPTQWKLAMEVAGRFVQSIGRSIPVDGQSPICLDAPLPKMLVPLHDSYVVHHFDEVLADRVTARRATAQEMPDRGVQLPVSLHEIRESRSLCRALLNLVDGTLLRPRRGREPAPPAGPGRKEAPAKSAPGGVTFADPCDGAIRALLEQNLGTWNDEFCLLAGRTAIIMPSQRWRDHELSISTVPSATVHVEYTHYWLAIERMIEFLVEVRVFTQLLENATYELLAELASAVDAMRTRLLSGDIRLDDQLKEQVVCAGYLRRQAAFAQGLSHPQIWSRTEYAIEKAERLLERMGVPQTLEHIQRNIDSITSVVDHVDDLHLAGLSEQSNAKTTLLSLSLAAASLTLTLLILPSFWADSMALWEQAARPTRAALAFVLGVGTLLAGGLMYLAAYLIRVAWRNKQEVRPLFKKFLDGASTHVEQGRR